MRRLGNDRREEEVVVLRGKKGMHDFILSSDCVSCWELQQELKEKQHCIKLLERRMRMEGNWKVEAIQASDEKTLFTQDLL